jgi:putative membrane protein
MPPPMPVDWSLDPLTVLSLASAGAIYLMADHRVRHGRTPNRIERWRRRAFLAGLLVIFAALQSPIEAGATTSFSIHMVQHLLLTMVAAPLLVLGAPMVLALRAWHGTPRRALASALRSAPVRLVTNPLVAWSLFIGVMWGVHLTWIYDSTLRNQGVHVAEHAAFLVTAVLFWMPVVGADPIPSQISHPARILYLFLAMPAMAFLGLALVSSRHVLYPTYAQVQGIARALVDQRAAGAIMWGGTMILIVPAMAFVLLDWMRADEREANRLDARLMRPVGAR